jgi:hypothetical protein
LKQLKYFSRRRWRIFLDKTATKPVIWIIDRQQWPRACIRAELIERGIEAIGSIELSKVIAALNDPNYLKPRLIILELCDLSYTRGELDALARAGIPMIALGGAVELNEELVRNFKWATMMRRPFTIGTVADVIGEILGHITATPLDKDQKKIL